MGKTSFSPKSTYLYPKRGNGGGDVLLAVHGGARHQHVGARLHHQRRGLGGDAAVYLQLTGGVVLLMARTWRMVSSWDSIKAWPPKPGSTVITSTMSSSSI